VQDFGAFVDLGGADGLLPVSQLRWTRVKHPSEVLQAGQQIKVQVLALDPDARKITLSLKGLEASPWIAAAGTYVVGSVHGGKVSKLADFGAFVELEPAVEGLVHISELSSKRVARVADAVREGDAVTVKVLAFDGAARRIGLSIKQAVAQAEPADDAPQAVADAAPVPAAAPKKARLVPLKGGTGGPGGPLFG
jgi:ribosomal protein S1